MPDRYLHFDNLDTTQREITSQCSRCGREFKSKIKPNERIDEVLIRIRAEFDAHVCP
jgi:hypothetical protein